MENISSEQMYAKTCIQGPLCPFLEQLDQEETQAQQTRDLTKTKQISQNQLNAGSAVLGAGGTCVTYMGANQFQGMRDHPAESFVAALIVGVAAYFFGQKAFPDESVYINEHGHKDLNTDRYTRLRGKIVRIDAEIENINNSYGLGPREDSGCAAMLDAKLQCKIAKEFFESTVKRQDRLVEHVGNVEVNPRQ